MGRARLAIALLGALLAWSRPAGANLPEEERRIIEAVKMVKPCVVKIETHHPMATNTGLGSGVILRHDGFILTNFHVIRGAMTERVFLPNGRSYPARVWKASPARDLAVLKINARNLPVPRFGNSDKVELGETAIAIGSPLRFSWSVTRGTVSAVGRDVSVNGVYYRGLIQTDAAINPGSSGGALIDSSGDVIGINTLVYTGTEHYPHAQGLAFAIPINEALRVAQELVGKETVGPDRHAPAALGIEAKTVTSSMADLYGYRVHSGVLVKTVEIGGAAEAAGLHQGDVITEAQGQAVRSVADLRAVITRHHPGDDVEMIVWGLGKRRRKVRVILQTGR